MQRVTSGNTMLYSLQIGRALAAIAVVVHHAAGAVFVQQGRIPNPPLQLLELGYLGVDYFFVLSGFIIAHTAWEKPRDLKHARAFFRARILRIFVPYLPIALGLLAVLTAMPSMGENLTYSLFASLTLLPSNELPVLSVAWSLQHELVFYAWFGICFFVLRRPPLLALWVIPILILPFIVAPRWVNVVAGFYNLEFLFGVVACVLYHAGHGRRFAWLLLALGGVLLALACHVLLQGAIPHYYRVIAGFGFLPIVLALAYLEERHSFIRLRPLVFLGAASYAIYLVHAPFLSVFVKLLSVFPHWSLSFVVFLGAAMAAGVMYHLVIERPLMGWVRRRWPSPS